MENYKKALGLLTSAQKFRIKLGLERINALLALLGSPHKNLNVIHVAGTNGKGSVCAILSSVFAAAGYKTGLYTSPHLVSYTERIKINNKPVDEEKFAQLVCEICDIAQKNNIEPTEFEVLTAAMFKYFHDEGAEICIVETGLGGRFDATNVLENPVCSIITSISKDHTERLGNTIDQIAFEKAGIIKQNSKVVCESENAGFEVIKNAAQSRNAQLFTPSSDVSVEFTGGRNFAGIDGKTYEFGLVGQYQEGNLRLALEAIRQSGLKISEKALASGLKKVFHPCRIQYLSEKKLIIDGAHNPDGAKRLRETLDLYFGNEEKLWIFGALKNKDYEKMAKTLFKKGDEVFVCEFSHANHADFAQISAVSPVLVKRISPKKVSELAGSSKKLKIIAGSLYMAGEILEKNEDLRKLVYGGTE